MNAAPPSLEILAMPCRTSYYSGVGRTCQSFTKAWYFPKSVLPVAISGLRIALLLPIFALMGVFCIEKPVRFELKPVRFGILEKLSR
jgi:hypothetical protein